MSASSWEMVVGLEVHVQLKTRTKAFCACSTDFGEPPNKNTCPVCLALPGALPVLNQQAVTLAVRAALALESTVHERSVFARKNYFYPDLPKGYQISQADRPLATGGRVVLADGTRLGITRIHMEEDAGKSIHDRYPGMTAIDLNRSGVPLIEIVGEPEIRSSAQAGAYLRVLREVLLYCGVSDVSMEEGSLRVDANVSARPRGETAFRQRTEIKNLNSFSNVERALELEFVRHVRTYEAGGTIAQQTMLFDAAKQEVRPARSKEGSHDYRYFPEPDLPPLVLTRVWIEEQRRGLPELPAARRAGWMSEHSVSPTDAAALSADPGVARFFEGTAIRTGDYKAAASWVSGSVLQQLHLRGESIDEFPVKEDRLAELIEMQKAGELSSTAAKVVFSAMLTNPERPRAVSSDLNLLQVGDDAALERWIAEVWAEHPDEAKRFAAGEKKLQGVLVGFVMKTSQGRADPKRVNQLLAARATG